MIASESVDEAPQLPSGPPVLLLPSATSFPLSAAESGGVNLLLMPTYDALGSLLVYLDDDKSLISLKQLH